MNSNATPLLRAALCVLTLAGIVGPWWFNLAYFAGGGSVAPAVFFGHATANALTTAITIDVYLAALAFAVAVGADRRAGPWRWWAVVGCFAIGLAAALPGYLLWRSTRPA